MRPLKIFFMLGFFLSFGAATVQADFGNRFIADRRLETVLDSPDKKISYRFTCQDDMTLSAAAVFCVKSVSPPAYLVSLQDDVDGLPSGRALASSTFAPRSQSWATLPLDAVPLRKGKVYHLVVEQDALRGGAHPVGLIGPSNNASFLSTDVLNRLHPNDGSPDPRANSLFFSGGKWKELDQEPVYAVYGTGSYFQGNPYDDPGVRPIHGDGDPKDKSGQVLQGQVLHFHCGYPVKALAFRVRRQGHPTAPLNYIILSHNYHTHTCNILHPAVTVDPGLVSTAFQWVTVGVPKEVPNFPAECYFFVLQTDAGRKTEKTPGCEDCYLLSDVGNSGGLARSADLTFDGGAHLSRATRSIDGGDPTHWIDEFERDANLVAIGPLCPAAVPKEFTPLPTPVPIENEPRYEP